jgi:hypothetical protein
MELEPQLTEVALIKLKEDALTYASSYLLSIVAGEMVPSPNPG